MEVEKYLIGRGKYIKRVGTERTDISSLHKTSNETEGEISKEIKVKIKEKDKNNKDELNINNDNDVGKKMNIILKEFQLKEYISIIYFKLFAY